MSLVLIIVIPLIAEAVDWCSEDLKCPYEEPEEHTMCLFKDETETPRCSGIVDLQSDTNRQLMAQLHNEYRRKIAMGEVPGWPTAANMRRLTYDMTLEKIAYRWATQCWPDHDKCRKTIYWPVVGQNIAHEFSSVPKLQANPASDVNEWWNEILNTDPMSVDGFSLIQTSKAQFTQMIWATTEKVGCAMVSYKLRSNISCPYLKFTVCNYGPGGNMIAHPIYERGPPCSNCPYGDCVCETSPMVNPQFVEKFGTFWTRTTRTGKDTVKSLFNPIRKLYAPKFPDERKPVSSSARFGSRGYWCSEELSCKNEFPPQHTMCLHHNQINTLLCSNVVNLMTDCDREKIIRSHNFYRRKIAMGQVPGWPSATNMRMLTYDETLEEIAFRWAIQCIEQHDKCRRTADWWSVGQNIAREYAHTPLVKANPESDVEAWWAEVDDANPRVIDGFYVENNRKLPQTGHFFQLVWAETEKVGCATVSYKKKTPTQYPYVRVTVCNYGPGGNVISYPVYEKGYPCSRCPTNVTCVCDFKEAVIAACNETSLEVFEGFTDPHYDFYSPILPYASTPAARSLKVSRSGKNIATPFNMLSSVGEFPLIGTLYGHKSDSKKVRKTMLTVPNEAVVTYPPLQLERSPDRPVQWPWSENSSTMQSFISSTTLSSEKLVGSMGSRGNDEQACMLYQGYKPPYVVAYERPVAKFVSDLPMVRPAWVMVMSTPRMNYYSGKTMPAQGGFEHSTAEVYLQGRRSLSDFEVSEGMVLLNDSLPSIEQNGSALPQITKGVTTIHHHLISVSDSDGTEESYKELIVVTENEEHPEHNPQEPEKLRIPDDETHPVNRTAGKNGCIGRLSIKPSVTVHIFICFPYLIN